jgi:hypothetical protein
MKILFQEYYESSNFERNEELKQCLQLNISNPHIDKIYLFTELDITFESKVEVIKINERFKYRMFLQWILECGNDEDIYILSNSDIYVQDANMIDMYNLNEISLALTRWEYNQNDCCMWISDVGYGLYRSPSDSQDTWIIKRPKITQEMICCCDFKFGVPACDNTFAWILQNYGFNPKNKCLTIKTFHYHKTNYRTYQHNDRLAGPYHILQPN